MAKIHSYYLFNMKNELSYISQQYTNEELYEMINNSTFLQFEKEDDEVDNETNPSALEISNHKVQVLIIESFFDLKDTVKCLDNDDKNSDESDIDSDNNSNVDSDNNSNIGSDNNSDVDSKDLNDSANDNNENEMESDYDVEKLAQQHLLDDDLIGNTL
ncbi:hypothetical protein RhiirA4_428112 [Rhizophagus irregularis]|uniref:Uncharacterized protein n=1 Tax=Rhizophagus irregularis TaxID=588596 RepID=A0A2I1HBI3_9GLOM|nr:hypothetical protein RhiirA4_428112 [Rhizophagus irregularis]